MDTFAGNSFNAPGDYHIEISGWGVDNSFFVERSNLQWTAEGEKRVHLHRAIPEGAMVFVRLLTRELCNQPCNESSNRSVPVAYRVQRVLPIDSQGGSWMSLVQLHPRCRESLVGKGASNISEDSRDQCEAINFEVGLQCEEIFQ
jgi:hypothetical protein